MEDIPRLHDPCEIHCNSAQDLSTSKLVVFPPDLVHPWADPSNRDMHTFASLYGGLCATDGFELTASCTFVVENESLSLRTGLHIPPPSSFATLRICNNLRLQIMVVRLQLTLQKCADLHVLRSPPLLRKDSQECLAEIASVSR